MVFCKVCGLKTNKGKYRYIYCYRAGTKIAICDVCRENIKAEKNYKCARCGRADDDKNLFYDMERNGIIKVICVGCLGDIRNDEKKVEAFMKTKM